MTRSIPFLIIIFFAITSYGQSFEGKIVYQNKYKSKTPPINDKQLTKMMGAKQEYFIKDGDYKSTTDGTYLQWQLYVNKDNKLYNKMSTSETLFWIDGAFNIDEVFKVEINRNVIEILGYKCDEIILSCKSGVQKYYFNTKFAVDPKLFENHKYGNWYDFLSKSNSLPLKIISDNSQFTLESIAVEVKEMKLDKAFFELPANAKIIKSTY